MINRTTDSQKLKILEKNFDELGLIKNKLDVLGTGIFTKKKEDIMKETGSSTPLKDFHNLLKSTLKILTECKDYKLINALKELSDDVRQNLLESFFSIYHVEYDIVKDMKEYIEDTTIYS